MEMKEHNHLVQVLYDDGNTETIDWTEHVADICAADIFASCAICEEDIAMSSNDYRARGVFICDKCKAAIKHVRDYLENGGSVC